jgi:hypothetical protein
VLDGARLARAFQGDQPTYDVRRIAMQPALGLASAGGSLPSVPVCLAVLFALRLTNWASDGFWSPTGEYLFVLIPLTLLWILVTSVILTRSATAAPTG